MSVFVNKWFISDHHINHKNILSFEGENRKVETLEEMHDVLVSNHNSVVKPEDVVVFGGDVIFGADPDYSILHRMNGRKWLCIGNHDTPAKVREYVKIFEKVQASFDIETKDAKYCVQHRPIHPWEIDVDGRYDFCIHGHLHSDQIPDSRYVNVSCENINMTPISFSQIQNILRQRGFTKV